MLTQILAVAALLLIGIDIFLFLQVTQQLKKHGNEPLESLIPYLSRRLTLFIINSIVITAIQLTLIFHR